MCQFKSFIYNPNTESFHYSDTTESHTSIIYDNFKNNSSTIDDLCYKFEIIPDNQLQEWNFIIDTIPYNAKIEQIKTCKKKIVFFIMRKIYKWQDQGISRSIIKNKISFDDYEDQKIYDDLNINIEISKNKISELKSDISDILADLKTLKQFKNSYKKEIAYLNRKKRPVQIEIDKINDILNQDKKDFKKIYKKIIYIPAVGIPTRENITKQVNNSFDNLLKNREVN